MKKTETNDGIIIRVINGKTIKLHKNPIKPRRKKQRRELLSPILELLQET